MQAGEERFLKYVWKDAALRLKKVGVKTSLLDSRMLLQEVLKITYEELLVSATRLVTEEELKLFEEYLARRVKREPVSKILNRKDFWKHTFKTNEHTLDPRPETETLIEAVLNDYKDKNRELKILDLGTGTGCLIITLLKEFPKATGVAVDRSMDALKIAGDNADTIGVADRVNFVKGDWFKGIEEKFDIIVSNPPYIKSRDIDYLQEEVRMYDPKDALDGGVDGLDAYRDITAGVEKVMSNHARVYFEIGKWQENEVCNLIKEKAFAIHEVRKDILGIPRIISFNKPYLKVVGNNTKH
jgi:release factor glutamine methyltransferase